jgi:anti-sigma factor RsiW
MTEHLDNMTLMAYQDGELSGERLAQVEGHVAGCAACRAELEGMKGLSGMFDSARELKAPVGLAGRIKAKTRERVSVWGEGETLKIARWLTLAAAGVMAVASAGLWMRSVDGVDSGSTAYSGLSGGRVQFDSASTLMLADASQVGTPGSEDRQFAQWMVADLSGRLAANGKGKSHE